jgi:hypothetical protein
LDGNGGRGPGARSRGIVGDRGAFGLFKVLEFLEGVEVVALDGIDAALEAVELIVAAVEDPAQGVVVREESPTS